MPPRAGSLQLSPGLEELLIPPPPIRLFTVQLNLFRAKFSSPGKGKPGAAALWQNIIISASYFSLHFCRALLLQKGWMGAFLAPEVPPALSCMQAALLQNARTRQPCLQLWQAPWGDSAGARSLQSSVHNITYIQRNAPNGEDLKTNLVQKPADSEE